MFDRDEIVSKMDFNGPFWVLLENLLKQERNSKLNTLLSADSEKSADKVRGAIQYIDSLLMLKQAALKAAQRTDNGQRTFRS